MDAFSLGMDFTLPFSDLAEMGFDDGLLRELEMANENHQPSPKVSSKIVRPKVSTTEPLESTAANLICPVGSCGGKVFTRPAILKRHWQEFHMRDIRLWLCPIEGCSFVQPREDKTRDHAAKRHPDAFTNEADRRNQLRHLPQRIEKNLKFVDPCGVQQPLCVGELIPEPRLSENARVNRLAPVHPSRKARPGPGRALKRTFSTASPVKSDERMVVAAPAVQTSLIPSSLIQSSPEPTPPKKTCASIIPTTSTVPPVTMPKNQILKEFYLNEHKIIVLQKRNRELKHQLKTLEVDEERRLREDVKSKDQNIKTLEDLLRVRDREIRHLKSEW